MIPLLSSVIYPRLYYRRQDYCVKNLTRIYMIDRNAQKSFVNIVRFCLLYLFRFYVNLGVLTTKIPITGENSFRITIYYQAVNFISFYIFFFLCTPKDEIDNKRTRGYNIFQKETLTGLWQKIRFTVRGLSFLHGKVGSLGGLYLENARNVIKVRQEIILSFSNSKRMEQSYRNWEVRSGEFWKFNYFS